MFPDNKNFSYYFFISFSFLSFFFVDLAHPTLFCILAKNERTKHRFQYHCTPSSRYTTSPHPFHNTNMHLQVYIVDGKRVYTLKKVDPEGKPTLSAHPARFSPDDKFSRHRVVIKRRFKVLPSERRLQPL